MGYRRVVLIFSTLDDTNMMKLNYITVNINADHRS